MRSATRSSCVVALLCALTVPAGGCVADEADLRCALARECGTADVRTTPDLETKQDVTQPRDVSDLEGASFEVVAPRDVLAAGDAAAGKVDGASCSKDSECASRHCQNGFCCLSGDCCAVGTDCPSDYWGEPVCDEPERCQGHRFERACVGNVCERTAVDDDRGCSEVRAADCQPWGIELVVECGSEQEQWLAYVCPTACSRDTDCPPGAKCNEVCRAGEDGAQCWEDGDCHSGHCQNHFCCETGDCCAVAGQCPASYGASVCDEPATCQGHRTAACVDHVCASGPPVDDDRGCTAATEADGCGPYASRYCSGEEVQAAPTCPLSCSGDEACDEGFHCDGACVADGLNGEACDEDSDCASNRCQSGSCCASGDCCGTAADCDDGDPCTDDRCDLARGGCVHGFNAASCDDGTVCNGREKCDPATGACRAGTPLFCEDDNPCDGVEVCDPARGCVAGTPMLCDDFDACDGVEWCHHTRGCMSGTPLACDDHNVCNGEETCDAAVGCLAGVPLACDGSDVCNGLDDMRCAGGADYCAAGACMPDCAAQGCASDFAPVGETCRDPKIVGRLDTRGGISLSGDTTYMRNDDDDQPSSSACWDANRDAVYRIYLMPGDLLELLLTPGDPLYNAVVKLYLGTSCASTEEADPLVCAWDAGDGEAEAVEHTATAEGWYTIVVDGASAFDDNEDWGAYELAAKLTCAQRNCCCHSP